MGRANSLEKKSLMLEKIEGLKWRRAQSALGSPMDCKQIKPVNSKENQHLIFIGRTDAETEAPIIWPPDAKS